MNLKPDQESLPVVEDDKTIEIFDPESSPSATTIETLIIEANQSPLGTIVRSNDED